MTFKNLSIQGLRPKDELNLYLVLNGLKPATTLELDPTYIESKSFVTKNDSEGILKIFTEGDIDLSYKEIREFTTTLSTHNLAHIKHRDCPLNTTNEFGTNTFVNAETYFVAKDNQALERLITSWNLEGTSRQDHQAKAYAIGLSLGYPENASRHFTQIVQKYDLNGRAFFDVYKDAIKSNSEIPLWLGYIHHIPTQLDIVNNSYSKESEEQGKMYESFVRQHNKWLATKVDASFRQIIKYYKKEVEKEQKATTIL